MTIKSDKHVRYVTKARDGMTLDEIAQHFGLTRERIRQIEASALRKVRRKLQIRGLTFKDLLNSLHKD